MSCRFKSEDDSILYAKLRDAKRLSEKRQFPSFVGFLNEQQISQSVAYLKSIECYTFKLYGGYENCERSVLGIFPKGSDMENYMFPISAVAFEYKKEYSLTHRDFLGSVMGLGIKRESVGDILILAGKAIMLIRDDIKEYIISQITKVGSVGVKTYLYTEDIIPQKPQFKELNCTVASLRLDNIVSAITGLSREKSARLIKTGMVAVNSLAVQSVSAGVKADDKISVRGKGKFIVGDTGGLTKKGRYKLTVKIMQ